MKRILITTFAMLSLVAFCLGAALSSHTSSLNGQQGSPGVNDSININMTARGDLPGGFNITFEHSDGAVSGGEWSLVVIEKNADGTDREAGTLKGTVSSGNAEMSAGTKRISSGQSQLTITGGTGRYADATGSGSFNCSVAATDSHELNGALGLNF